MSVAGRPTPPSARARAAVAALAGGGVAVTHWIAYALAVPHDGHRAGVLAATGHGYALYAMPLVLATLVAALARYAAAGMRGDDRAPPRAAAVATRLAALQGGGFAVLEVVERVASGAGVAELSVPLAVGLVVQLAVALAGALLLVALAKVVRALAHARRRARARTTVAVRPTRVAVVRSLVACGGATVRGPPAAA